MYKISFYTKGFLRDFFFFSFRDFFNGDIKPILPKIKLFRRCITTTKLFFTEEKRDIFDCSYWYLSAENAIYWCLEHPNCQIFSGELVCHPVNFHILFSYLWEICSQNGLFLQSWGTQFSPSAPNMVSQQEGQLRNFFWIFQNQRVSSLYFRPWRIFFFD